MSEKDGMGGRPSVYPNLVALVFRLIRDAGSCQRPLLPVLLRVLRVRARDLPGPSNSARRKTCTNKPSLLDTIVTSCDVLSFKLMLFGAELR